MCRIRQAVQELVAAGEYPGQRRLAAHIGRKKGSNLCKGENDRRLDEMRVLGVEKLTLRRS